MILIYSIVMNSTNLTHCLKCKSKKEMINGQIKTNVKGNKYISGNCKDCSCKMNKFIKKDDKIEPTSENKKSSFYVKKNDDI